MRLQQLQDKVQKLQERRQELQTQFKEVSEDIRNLNMDYHNEIDLERKGKLKRRIKKEEQQLEKIEEYIHSNASQREDLRMCKVFDELLRLDYVEHIKRFENFVDHHKQGAFLVHGSARYALRFLLTHFWDFLLKP